MRGGAESIDDFVALVREYRALVDRAPRSKAAAFLRSCLNLLPRIYAAGIALPEVEPESEDVPRDVESPIRALGELLDPRDMYSEVYDPFVHEEPVRCLISDDLADIYLDLVNPLVEYDAGRVADAVWSWRFNLRGHSGDKIVDTLRAIHRLVHDSFGFDPAAGQGEAE